MENRGKKLLTSGIVMMILFVVWTVMIRTFDLRPVGQNGTSVGFAKMNVWFHSVTGVNMMIYKITDWLSIVPMTVCMVFGTIGLVQLIRRRSLFKVDKDILLLGVYYILVLLMYFVFEVVALNYRPILIDGCLEASYPSSTTLLVLSVMPTLFFQTCYRVKNVVFRNILLVFAIVFSLFMVVGRTVAGVHWLTDIIGSIFLSSGLYLVYHGLVGSVLKEDNSKVAAV